MPHIHEKIDFTVVAVIVHDQKMLLVHHKQLNTWLPVGGHIELDEDPEEALFREVKEESGLEIEVIAEKPPLRLEGRKYLYAPTFLDIHDISPTHKHIGMVYLARAESDAITLAEYEHNAIRWFTESELNDPQFDIQPNVQYYAREALRRLV